MKTLLTILVLLLVISEASGQHNNSMSAIDLGYNDSFNGFELIRFGNNMVFIIAEDAHNRKYAPAMTLKFLQALHLHNVRTLAIEGGISTAFLINCYLQNQDTTLLREISRHTFYWSREHFSYYQALARWNNSLPPDKRVVIESADIEIKQESVIFAVNLILDGKNIPDNLSKLESFRTIFREREPHRLQYLGLNVQYYYDKKKCSALVDEILADMTAHHEHYQAFFADHYDLFNTMMNDLHAQYVFDYRTNSKFKFRDDLMYEKLLDISKRHPEGFLHVVGAKHTRPSSSSYRLSHEANSPFKDKVIVMNLTGKNKNGKYPGAKVVTKLAIQHPQIFRSGSNIIINNEKNSLHNGGYFNYTLALADNDHVTPFPNSYWGK